MKYLILILCLLFIGCTATQLTETTPAVQDSLQASISECSSLSNDPAKDNCFLNLAVKQKDFTVCRLMPQGEFSGLRYRDCYETVGMKIADINACPDDDQKNFCYQGAVIGSLRDDLCESTSNPDKCYLKVGVAKNDSEICNKADTSKALCMMNVAINTKNRPLCDTIEAGVYRATCINSVK